MKNTVIRGRAHPRIYKRFGAVLSVRLMDIQGTPADWFAFEDLSFYIDCNGLAVPCSREDVAGDRLKVRYRPPQQMCTGAAFLCVKYWVNGTARTIRKFAFEIVPSWYMRNTEGGATIEIDITENL